MTYREAYETWLKEFADERATVDELRGHEPHEPV